MYKHARTKRAAHTKYDLNDDLAKIKGILAQTAYDVNGRAREVISDSYDTVKEKTTSIKDDIQSYTQNKPIAALGWSFVAGLIFGIWTFRKK